MVAFINGEYDILLATTIIENGLDIPNANTIIIYDAQNFGLSDLHQLRGRVGRSNRKSFCYLITPPLHSLPTDARKRLKAIEEYADLGSGFNIAMRDLDIRGAGNILGAEQSGFIAEMGYETYLKILDEAIRELKETTFKEQFNTEHDNELKDCIIETDLELLIPSYYVENISERIQLYKQLDNITHEEELVRFHEHLTDRFGQVPPQCIELIDTKRLRWKAASIGAEKIIIKNNRLVVWFIANKESNFFDSAAFSKVLDFVQMFPLKCRLKEANEKLSLIIEDIKTVQDAMRITELILQKK